MTIFSRTTRWTDAPEAGWLRIATAVIGSVLVAVALAAKPQPAGDALEYLLQTESLARHASPEVRANDILSLARQAARLQLDLNFAVGYQGYFDTPSGKWYALHFWAYSLLAVPARLVLGLLGLSGLRAFPLTNAVFLLVALHHLLCGLPFRLRWRIVLAALLLTSPVLYFLRWPHAEVITVAATVMALTMRYAGRPVAALIWAALAALQSPSFVILVGLLWVDAVLGDLRWRTAWRATTAGSLCFLAPVFYLSRFGTPSLIAREAASVAHISARRAAELVVDPNIGLVRAMPVTVVLLALCSAWTLTRARQMRFEAGLVIATALMALACTPTDNWNHATIGPSRYAVWLSPIVVFLVVRFGQTIRPGKLHACYRTGLILAIATQAVVMVAKGGPLAEPDYLEHSHLARFVLRHAPALYSPSVPIFAARTTHQYPAPVGPYVYAEGGRCRKVLMRSSMAEESMVRQACGTAFPSSKERGSPGRDGDDWVYVDY